MKSVRDLIWEFEEDKFAIDIFVVRASLRVLPFMDAWLELISDDKLMVSQLSDFVLPAFRASSISFIALYYNLKYSYIPEDITKICRTKKIPDSIINGNDIRAIAINTAISINCTVDCILSLGYGSGDKGDILDMAIEAINKADAACTTIYNSILKNDYIYLSSFKSRGRRLEFLLSPLWGDVALPERVRKQWKGLTNRLRQRKDEHWEVWTNWYEARLDPSRHIPCYSPLIPELERKRVLLPEEVWKAGPARANAEIKRLIEESGCARSEDDDPPLPAELPGVRFSMDEEGRLHVVSSHPDEEEANDPVQQRMFARLKQKMAQLMSHMNAIGNQYPELANVLRDYDEELSVISLAEIDIPMVWMTGLGVMEQAEAFRRIGEDALTPRLEPEVEGLLREVAGLHGAFITGFGEGRELIARRMQGQFGPQAVERLHEAQLQFLNFALQLDASALTERARAVFGKAKDVLLLRGMQAEDKIGATLHVSVNALVAAGKGLWPLIVTGLPAAAMGSEGVQAWLQFLQAHGSIIAAIAQTLPELRAYLRHLFDKAGIPWPDPDDDPQAG